MKFNVDENTCIGCGACAAAYSNTFKINEKGVSEAIENPEVAEEVDVDICPVGAITEKTTEAAEA